MTNPYQYTPTDEDDEIVEVTEYKHPYFYLAWGFVWMFVGVGELVFAVTFSEHLPWWGQAVLMGLIVNSICMMYYCFCNVLRGSDYGD